MKAGREAAHVVDAESLEKELNRVRAAAAGPVPGIFGPRSVTWQIDREAAIFLEAGRTLLLHTIDRLKELSEAANDHRTLIVSASCKVRAVCPFSPRRDDRA
jgi:hypothetical protein